MSTIDVRGGASHGYIVLCLLKMDLLALFDCTFVFAFNDRRDREVL